MSTNPMTRQEAEAAGWESRNHCVYVRWFKHVSHGVHIVECRDDASALQSITSIERYADAERMLEEIELECMHAIESGRDSKAMKAVEEIRAMLEARK